jgi:hypothetical protein
MRAVSTIAAMRSWFVGSDENPASACLTLGAYATAI